MKISINKRKIILKKNISYIIKLMNLIKKLNFIKKLIKIIMKN